ncbi:chain-length determining protein [Pseudomonas brassicacearum]|uniref:Chain-length determining protein n=1 Tax=Pseudomonas brassicacearum TaxID=930166 RepID=A0A423H684_9PSED|nr:Wzz/FepE/Etk N-terminal domain-containing protein [Pseudomonas brassicacearum]RON08701.1 chain-length determining protein [Pseudomonas brassicacearum]
MNEYTDFSKISNSDEIDLAEVFRAVWKQKFMVATAVILFGLLALVYSFIATQEYKVSSVLRPAAINELDALNRSEIYKLPQSEALSKVGAALESYETRLNFFRTNEALFEKFKVPGVTLEQSFEEFNRNSIALIVPDLKKNDALSAFIRLELTYPKGIDGVGILNGFVNFAIAAERQKIGIDLKVIIDNRLRELNEKLDAARSTYDTEKEAKIASLLEVDTLKRAQLQDELKALRLQLKTVRSDRVAQLSEAISIAKALGIKKPATPSSLADSEHSGSGSVIRTEVNSQQIPLYFMGTDALEAERVTLQQRKSDDFTEKRIAEIAKELQLLQVNRQVEVLKQRENEDVFLRDVEPLRSEIARLRNLNIDMSNIKLVTIDQQALQPPGPIKPKKVLVVVLGLVLGLLVGVILVVIRHFVTARRTSMNTM